VSHSLRLRLLISVLALLLPAAAAAGVLLAQLFANRLLRDLDVALEEEAATVAALLQRPATGDMMELLEQIADETDLGVGKRIVVRRGNTVIGEVPSGSAAVLAAGGDSIRRATAVGGPAAAPLTVMVAVPATAALHATRRLELLLLIGVPASLVLLAAGLWLVMGRALRPLEIAAQRMEAIDASDLRPRVPLANPEDEVGRMVAALNRMLDRVAAAVAELQRFTADAAHELRTPLAVLRAGLEVTLARPRDAAAYRAALEEALGATERLADLAEDLLTLTRMEALPPNRPIAPLRLGEMLQELADAWAGRAAGQDIEIAVDADPAVEVHGAAPDLYRLFGNLIENSLRHTPAGGRITLVARVRNGRAEVRVTDTGSGIPPAELPRVFDRFYRARGEPGRGSGLGLSIARAIAHAHAGTLVLSNEERGGCSAVVSLPLVRRAA